MEKMTNNQLEAEETVVNEAVEMPVEAEAAPVEEEKKYVVNCYRCGAALKVKASNVVYMCPVCNNLFRVRIGEKLVKDLSRPEAEA